MSDAVAVALIGLAGTLIATVAAVFAKRRFAVSDRRQHDEDRCERLALAFGQLLFYGRQRQQQIMSLAQMGDTKPDYVLQRLKELAEEPTPFAGLQQYVEQTPRLGEPAQEPNE